MSVVIELPLIKNFLHQLVAPLPLPSQKDSSYPPKKNKGPMTRQKRPYQHTSPPQSSCVTAREMCKSITMTYLYVFQWRRTRVLFSESIVRPCV